MTELTAEFKALANYRPQHKVRFVTAASLFDGHDASINIMRRILQGMGAEVIHLGHNRSVEEIVTAALQEDAQGIAISSYQGGHVEYFKYAVDLLKAQGGEHIQVFGGGGGVIVPAEIRELQAYGVARIYSPEDGQRMGLQGMIGEMVMRCDRELSSLAPRSLDAITGHGPAAWRALAQVVGMWPLRGFGSFSVLEKATGRWVGRAGPWQPEDWPALEVGWMLHRSAWGHGYATEAAEACLRFAFETLGWTSVAHMIHPENLGSQAVAGRIGEGHLCAEQLVGDDLLAVAQADDRLEPR